MGFVNTIMFSVVNVLCLQGHKGKGLTTSLVPRMHDGRRGRRSSESRWSPRLPGLTRFSKGVLRFFSKGLEGSFRLVRGRNGYLFSLRFCRLNMRVGRCPNNSNGCGGQVSHRGGKARFSGGDGHGRVTGSNDKSRHVTVPRYVSMSIGIQFGRLSRYYSDGGGRGGAGSGFVYTDPFWCVTWCFGSFRAPILR